VEKSGNGSGSGNGGGVGNNGSGDAHDSPFAASPARRTVLLCVFSLSIALDVVNVSALLTTTETIASDLGLVAGNVTWMWVVPRDSFDSHADSKADSIGVFLS
jgi:hypothetical protein